MEPESPTEPLRVLVVDGRRQRLQEVGDAVLSLGHEVLARERERAGAYRERTGGNSLLGDVLVEEVRRKERLVAIDEEAAGRVKNACNGAKAAVLGGLAAIRRDSRTDQRINEGLVGHDQESGECEYCIRLLYQGTASARELHCRKSQTMY